MSAAEETEIWNGVEGETGGVEMCDGEWVDGESSG